MIIAAHAGTGKTYFSKNISDSVDFVCMPYKYYLPDGFIAGEDDETVKADMNLNIREEWPDNYCKAVIHVVLKEGEYLLDYLSHFDRVIAEKESIVSLEIDEEILSGFNSIYAKTGYSFQTFARREFIKIAKSGEWPVILNKRELEKEL